MNFDDTIIRLDDVKKAEKRIAKNKAHVVVSSKDQYPQTKKTQSGVKVLDTHVNLEWLLTHFNITIRYNLMTRQREISIRDLFISQEDTDNYLLNIIIYLAALNEMPTISIDRHLDVLALQNPYHPIVEALQNNPWDGVPRLDQFLSSIETENPEVDKRIIQTWMFCAMAAAHSKEGFINNGVLVLQGEQGIGKTAWIRSLDPLNCKAIKDGAFLDPNNKDSVAQLARYWIVELGEIECIFKKSEIGRLKSFITSQFDLVRTAYARKATLLPRRTVYIATVNEKNYLIDETGNRRWWTVSVKSVNFNHNLDMLQVWAEVYVISKLVNIDKLVYELQSLINQSNKDYEKIDPFKEKVLQHYDWEWPQVKWMTATAVLNEIGCSNPSPSDVRRMGFILKEINNQSSRKSNGLMVHKIPTRILP